VGTSNQISGDTYQSIIDFLHHEAELLDDGKFRQWVEQMVAKDITYRIPVRITRKRNEGLGFSTEAWHMNETWTSLEVRTARLETDFAYAEDPPSRTRHMVTNVRASPANNENEVHVKSNLLVSRSRLDTTDFQFIIGEKHDQLRKEGENWKLFQRVVYLDQTTLGSHDLAIFL